MTLKPVKRTGGKRWRNEKMDRFYEWDGLHGELEVYNERGRRLGSVDPWSGEPLKESEKGRRIDV